MFKSRIISWQTNYTAMFGSMTSNQFEAWDAYLHANCPNLRTEEIDKAVAELCDCWNDRVKPTVKDICIRIFGLRGVRHNSEETSKWMSEYKDCLRRVSNAKSYDDIWIVICKSSDSNMGAKLEEWAIRNRGFARAKCKDLQAAIIEFRDCYKSVKTHFLQHTTARLDKVENFSECPF